MEFFNPRFLAFFGVVLLGCLSLRGNSVRKLWLTLASLFFYAAWDWRYLPLLLFISAFDFGAAIQIENQKRPWARGIWLFLSLLVSLGALALFKYQFFFRQNVHLWWPELAPGTAWILPAGISFYTFKTMSYTLDVYRGQLRACRRWLDYALFVSFFPELIAGPIVRASIFLPQLERRAQPTWERARWGCNLFLQGLTQKILLADRLADLVDPVYLHPEWFSTPSVWMAVVATTCQIYLDFAGYSSMAIGCAALLGYDLPMNFDRPLLATDLRQLWRRWHITLGAWFRDYVYIPCGGNRRGWTLLWTMGLVGLWHGAGWTFVIWGLLHGLGLTVQRLWRARGLRMPGLPAWFLTQLFLVLAFALFRATDLGNASAIFRRLLGLGGLAGQQLPEGAFWMVLTFMAAGHLGLWAMDRPGWSRLPTGLGLERLELPRAGTYLGFARPGFASGLVLTLWLGVLLFYSSTQTHPFIYFQF